MTFEVFDFVPESYQKKTVQLVPEIHFYNDNLSFFAAKEEITKHFDRNERNIYSKHKDDAHEKEFIDLLYVFNRQFLIELYIIQYFVKILTKFRRLSSIPRTPEF